MIIAVIFIAVVIVDSLPKPALKRPSQVSFETIKLSDDEIRRLARSQEKFPPGFYQENLAGASIYYENTVSIRKSEDWFELSTDNRDQAFAWSEASSQKSSVYRALQSERQTEKYFEFRYINPDNPSDILLSRVHKRSYLDRSRFNHFNPTPLLGVFNFRPINVNTVQNLCEYLWFTERYNIVDYRILAIATTESADKISCALYYILIEGKLMIRVMRREYSVAKKSGEIYQTESLISVVQNTQKESESDDLLKTIQQSRLVKI